MLLQEHRTMAGPLRRRYALFELGLGLAVRVIFWIAGLRNSGPKSKENVLGENISRKKVNLRTVLFCSSRGVRKTGFWIRGNGQSRNCLNLLLTMHRLETVQIKSNLFASTKYKRKTVEKHKVNTKKSTTYRQWMLAGLKGKETALTWALKNMHSSDNVYNNMNFKYYKNCKKMQLL